MRFFSVDVSQIIGAADRDGFADEDVELLAGHILAAGGLVRPLVLASTGTYDADSRERLTLIQGHFEYWAAVRAKEIDRAGYEMVNAFVVREEKAIAAIDQLGFLELVGDRDAEEDGEVIKADLIERCIKALDTLDALELPIANQMF
jgi:hypothetical protein